MTLFGFESEMMPTKIIQERLSVQFHSHVVQAFLVVCHNVWGRHMFFFPKKQSLVLFSNTLITLYAPCQKLSQHKNVIDFQNLDIMQVTEVGRHNSQYTNKTK